MFKFCVITLFVIGAGAWAWIVNQLSLQFMLGLLFGAISTEIYYWKVLKIIDPRHH